jgi:hypothetical protein
MRLGRTVKEIGEVLRLLNYLALGVSGLTLLAISIASLFVTISDPLPAVWIMGLTMMVTGLYAGLEEMILSARRRSAEHSHVRKPLWEWRPSQRQSALRRKER